jgi:hypothetical protein
VRPMPQGDAGSRPPSKGAWRRQLRSRRTKCRPRRHRSLEAFFKQIKVSSLETYVDDTGKSSKPLRVIGMPTTLLIDPEGREIGRLVGPAEWDSHEAKKLIKAELR